MSEKKAKAPCGHPSPRPGCRWCGLAAKDPRYARLWWGEDATPKPRLSLAELIARKRH